jgi:hypothetical protein
MSLPVAALAVLTLAGCVPESYPEIPRFAESGGQTQAELDAKLATIPGLVFTDASGSKPNVKGNTGYGYDIELDASYQIADAPGLIDFLVVSAWSVRDGYMPNTTVNIAIDGGPLPSDKIDTVEAAEVAGWVPEGSQSHRIGDDGGSDPEFDNGWNDVDIWLATEYSSDRAEERGADVNRDRLGEWPGTAVDPPAGLVVPREPAQ